MIEFRAELHVHTVLSACAGTDMLPGPIVEAALFNEINLIAITDHNAGYNAAPVIKAGRRQGLMVLPGMELETEEEVHSLCLFDTLDQLDALQKIVDARLPFYPNNEDFYGPQWVVDEKGNKLRPETRQLLFPVQISIQRACRIVKDLGGLFIPAHINREANGLLSHLGTVPPDLDVQILEINRHTTKEACLKKHPELARYRLIQSGDVHYLDGFLGASTFRAKNSSLKAITEGLLSSL
ncbi:MAG TPA: PHP domain-containing protein [Anaerolineaceae bacterium]|nr:PHP domain-containing protein [Anaerolineaceae bacterium]